MDRQAFVLQIDQVGGERVGGGLGDLDVDDAGEVADELGHLAFEPVGVVAFDGVGEGLDEAGAVGADDGEDEGGHGEAWGLRGEDCDLDR